jgi:predicted Fe-Mo cluster-binding NifX family protein
METEIRTGPEARRVAIARVGDAVAPHISQAEAFAVYDCAAGEAVRVGDLEMPSLSVGFVLAFLQGHGIDAVIAGNTGGGFRALLAGNGIEVVRGVEGPVEDVARAYAAGTLERAEVACTEHDACSGCGACR